MPASQWIEVGLVRFANYSSSKGEAAPTRIKTHPASAKSQVDVVQNSALRYFSRSFAIESRSNYHGTYCQNPRTQKSHETRVEAPASRVLEAFSELLQRYLVAARMGRQPGDISKVSNQLIIQSSKMGPEM